VRNYITSKTDRQAQLANMTQPSEAGADVMGSDIAEEVGKTLARHILQVGQHNRQEQIRRLEVPDNKPVGRNT
jgi:hypothetical protein